jgi:pantoate kinase
MKMSFKAFSPAGISSFFEICDQTAYGRPLTDPLKVGARGGGFGIKKGVLTEVSVAKADRSSVEVVINRSPAPEAETTRTVVNALLSEVDERYAVDVGHKIEVPIGAGFGSSAGGALTTALALSKALDLKLTFNQIGRIAHSAEVKCKTGLGTVGPLMIGGCIITVEPGAPGIAVIDRIPISPDYVVVAGVFGPILTRQVLSSPEKRLAINKWGRIALEKILDEPSLENFLSCCLEFAEKTGFITERLQTLVRLAEKAGALGAAQNMVGEVVHAVTTLENVKSVVEAFKQVLPEDKIIVSEIDFQGARLMG